MKTRRDRHSHIQTHVMYMKDSLITRFPLTSACPDCPARWRGPPQRSNKAHSHSDEYPDRESKETCLALDYLPVGAETGLHVYAVIDLLR
jgi:hypothetical protein